MRTAAKRSVDAAATTRTGAGDARAEARIAADLERIGGAVRGRLGSRLRALLLVGGYARGEGGVVSRGGQPRPYNDYDLVAVMRRRRVKGAREALRAVGHELTRELGVDVDLWPIAEAALPTVPRTLFWLDVALGGAEVIVGDPSVLEALRRFGPRDVPHAEAARLLANRAVGIALSNLEAEDRDLRRARHHHKAVLACGDARLLAANRYRPTVAARADELSRLRAAPAIGDELAFAYVDAAEFRLRPDRWQPPGDEDSDSWSTRVRALVGRSHLDYEAHRVGTPTTAAGYAQHRGPLFDGAPDTGRGPAAAVRAWSQGQAPLWPWVGHPRERLARAAVALAYGHSHVGTRAVAARLLGLGDQPASGAAGTRGAPVTDGALHAALLRLTEVAG